MNMHLGATDTGAQHRLGLDRPAAHRESGEHGTQLIDIGTGIDERTERHISGDPREAMEPGDRDLRTAGCWDRHSLPRDWSFDDGVIVGVPMIMCMIMMLIMHMLM